MMRHIGHSQCQYKEYRRQYRSDVTEKIRRSSRTEYGAGSAAAESCPRIRAFTLLQQDENNQSYSDKYQGNF